MKLTQPDHFKSLRPAPRGISAQRVLAAFRKVYPGKRDTIVQALTVDWTRDKYAPTCEIEHFLKEKSISFGRKYRSLMVESILPVLMQTI